MEQTFGLQEPVLLALLVETRALTAYELCRMRQADTHLNALCRADALWGTLLRFDNLKGVEPLPPYGSRIPPRRQSPWVRETATRSLCSEYKDGWLRRYAELSCNADWDSETLRYYAEEQTLEETLEERFREEAEELRYELDHSTRLDGPQAKELLERLSTHFEEPWGGRKLPASIGPYRFVVEIYRRRQLFSPQASPRLHQAAVRLVRAVAALTIGQRETLFIDTAEMPLPAVARGSTYDHLDPHMVTWAQSVLQACTKRCIHLVLGRNRLPGHVIQPTVYGCSCTPQDPALNCPNTGSRPCRRAFADVSVAIQQFWLIQHRFERNCVLFSGSTQGTTFKPDQALPAFTIDNLLPVSPITACLVPSVDENQTRVEYEQLLSSGLNQCQCMLLADVFLVRESDGLTICLSKSSDPWEPESRPFEIMQVDDDSWPDCHRCEIWYSGRKTEFEQAFAEFHISPQPQINGVDHAEAVLQHVLDTTEDVVIYLSAVSINAMIDPVPDPECAVSMQSTAIFQFLDKIQTLALM